ncbi:MAG: 4-alpha-glucanotransferase [Faecalibacillus sp.]
MELKTLDERQAGVLLPLFSLPGRHGIGDLGQCAYDFIEQSAQAGFSIWQILPMNPSSAGNSPYTPYSSFAGDEIYISLDLLTQWGFIDDVPSFHQDENRINYPAVRQYKGKYLREAFASFKKDNSEYIDEYNTFVKGAFWLDCYARYMALKEANEGLSWVDWNDEDQDIQGSNEGLEDDIEYMKFLQFIFIKQFNLLKIHAHQYGISIMGDLPLYVGHDSADVYEFRECFQLDNKYDPLFVSGASPDYFSEDGQLWGHPLYDWDYLKKTNYDFWIRRLKWNNEIFDILRVDHFRAFDTYWSIPYGDKTARNGQWIEGPAYDFLDSVYKQLPELTMIVEDLGELREEVHELRDHYHLLGMRVMQFSFGPSEEKIGFKMPEHCVVYTGTHDNATLKEWYDDYGDKKRIQDIMKKLKMEDETVPEQVLHYTLSCDSVIAVIPVQDLLGYDKETRINLPGTVGDQNWSYKLTSLKDYKNHLEIIKDLLKETNRL